MDAALASPYVPTMEITEKPSWGFRLRPREWPAIFGAIKDDPDNVALGAELFFSIGGHDEEPNYRRFLATEEGAELVQNGTPYPALFTDYEALRALPNGTAGRCYVEELDERGIHPVELAKLTHAAYVGRRFTAEHAYVRDRVRDAHDFFHTLTGYGIDLVGESGVLGFTAAQTRNKGWGMLTFLNVLTTLFSWRLTGLKNAWRGYRAGRRAAYLPARSDLDRLLRLPLEEARVELAIVPTPPYEPVHLAAVFENSTNTGE